MAVGIGLVIDTLAFHSPPGIGLALGFSVAIVAVASTSYLLDHPTPPGAIPVTVVGLAVAACIGLRDSPALIAFNVFGSLVALIVLSQLAGARGGTATWSLKRYLDQPFHALGDALTGAVQFIGVDMREGVRSAKSEQIRAIVVGLILGLPLVLVFAGLFSSADGRFEAVVDRLFSGVVFGNLLGRILGSVVVGLVVVGIWRSAREPSVPWERPPSQQRLQFASGITVLMSLVAVFTLFVITQVIGDNPELVTGSDFSSNARQGFSSWSR